MNIYLVQHGESKSKDDDPQRPLTDKGRDESVKAASFAARHAMVNINCIIHSGKARAEQTAQIMAEYLKPAEGVKEDSGLAPNDNPYIWAERFSETNVDKMLVGHLPHLARLASWLLCQNLELNTVSFRNSGIVCLTRDEAGNWSVAWMVVPQMLP